MVEAPQNEVNVTQIKQRKVRQMYFYTQINVTSLSSFVCKIPAKRQNSGFTSGKLYLGRVINFC